MNSPRHIVTGWPNADRPAHADPPWRPSASVVAAVVGGLALLAAVGLGASSCMKSLGSARSTPTSASLITVSDTSAPTP